MTVYKVTWDNNTKGYQMPLGTDSQKFVILKIDDKADTSKLPIGGIAYCVVNEGNHWVIGCNSAMFLAHAKVPAGKMVNDKFERDPNIEKAFVSLFEENMNAYAVCLDGHAGGEALVSALNGKWIDSDFSILSTDSEKVKSVVEAIANGDSKADITGTISAKFAIIDINDDNDITDRKGNVLPHPEHKDGIPTVIPHLPKLATPKGKGSWGGGGKPGYMPTSERLSDINGMLGTNSLDDIVEATTVSPLKVKLAFALTGIDITIPLVGISQSDSQPAKVAKAKTDSGSDSTDVDSEFVEWFTEVLEKEGGNGDVSEFSPDAVSAIDSFKSDNTYSDVYLTSLYSLSKFTVNGKNFPFGVTKKKLAITGSIFTKTADELVALVAEHVL